MNPFGRTQARITYPRFQASHLIAPGSTGIDDLLGLNDSLCSGDLVLYLNAGYAPVFFYKLDRLRVIGDVTPCFATRFDGIDGEPGVVSKEVEIVTAPL